MIIDVVWRYKKAQEIFPLWRDGLRAALQVLADRDHTVRIHFGENIEIADDSDFILNWDNSTSEFIPQMKTYKQPKGLILTTELGLNVDALRNYDVIFPESNYVLELLKPHGIHAIKAFGTDEKLFRPVPSPKLYEAFYPGTFSPWKRNDQFAERYKDKGLILGTIQPDGWEIFKNCVDSGSNVMIGYYDSEILPFLYCQAEKTSIYAYEGSGRSVLESLSCGVPVEVASDNHKCQSYIKEFIESGLEPREFILQNYTAEIYADQIMKGIKSVNDS